MSKNIKYVLQTIFWIWYIPTLPLRVGTTRQSTRTWYFHRDSSHSLWSKAAKEMFFNEWNTGWKNVSVPLFCIRCEKSNGNIHGSLERSHILKVTFDFDKFSGEVHTKTTSMMIESSMNLYLIASSSILSYNICQKEKLNCFNISLTPKNRESKRNKIHFLSVLCGPLTPCNFDD